MKAFLVSSSGTFFGIIAADHASRSFEASRNQSLQYLENREERLRQQELARMSFKDRALDFMREEKYKIIGVTWIASIIGSFYLVGRNPYLTGQQKIVQARVYAQGLTLAVMCASAAFEIHDQRKGQGLFDAAKKGREANKEVVQQTHHERYEGEDLWKDMVAAEEQKMKQRHQPVYVHEKLKQEKEQQSEKSEEEEEQSEQKAEQQKAE